MSPRIIVKLSIVDVVKAPRIIVKLNVVDVVKVVGK